MIENDYAVMITLRGDYTKAISVTYCGCDLSKERLRELILEDLKVEVRIIPQTPSMEFKLKDEERVKNENNE